MTQGCSFHGLSSSAIFLLTPLSRISGREARVEPATAPATLHGAAKRVDAARNVRYGTPDTARQRLFATVGMGARRTTQVIWKAFVSTVAATAPARGNLGSTRSRT